MREYSQSLRDSYFKECMRAVYNFVFFEGKDVSPGLQASFLLGAANLEDFLARELPQKFLGFDCNVTPPFKEIFPGVLFQGLADALCVSQRWCMLSF